MWKGAATFMGIAVLLSAAFVVHAFWAGIELPDQDPTPERAAYERYHQGISTQLFLAAGTAWLAAGAALGAWTIRWLWRGVRALPLSRPPDLSNKEKTETP